ncbi:MAG: circularly permuted type 2 ATP-grasp protein [Myxococcota bacterium]
MAKSGPPQAQSQSVRESRPLFAGYAPPAGTYDEVFLPSGEPRPGVGLAVELLAELGRARFVRLQRLADATLLKGGITFSVYAQNRGDVERVFPFDMIPRTVSAGDWAVIERGLIQRVTAINAFLSDIYGEQRILDEGRIPRELVDSSAGYLARLRGVRPPGGVRVHIAGIDLIRAPSGEFLVLEDNVRTPSGVSYVLENRSVMKRAVSGVFAGATVRAVDRYPDKLRKALDSLAPDRLAGDGQPGRMPRLVVLTPGRFNSAYFEHSFLARRMGCDLVEASDLFVHDDRVWVKTTAGPQPVAVIYRRTDDEFIDPEVFRADSLLGVRGLVRAYARGNVTLANALGNGVADDKAIYPFVPEMIRFYLDEDPILGQVETYSCEDDRQRTHVLDHLDRMVVKAVDASGGYGMLMGPTASRAERAEFAERIRKNPRGYIAQPRVELSTCPTWIDGVVEPRRVDLRPYVVTGADGTWVLPGGLTRVALTAGSYVVNSSQGGGSKDTWVLGDES